jgi:hypothetical protein
MVAMHAMFRASFDVAWPLWAGGYPSQDEALKVLKDSEGDLRFAIEQRIKQLFGVELELSQFRYQGGSYRAITNLWPRDNPPNSLNLLLEVRAPETIINRREGLDVAIPEAVEDLATLVMTFFRDRMPGARRGANIYDVETRWDPGPRLAGATPLPATAELPIFPAPEPPAPVLKPGGKIFISYSHKDAKWLTQVQVALQPLKLYQEGIDFWDDTRIDVGSQWRADIKTAMEEATIVILLLSMHFLASEFIAKNELPPLMKAAKQHGKLIIPIIVEHIFIPPALGLDEFQSLNPPSKPLAGMSKVTQSKLFAELARMVHTHLS